MTSNCANINATGIVYHDGAATFTGVNPGAGKVLLGNTGNEPRSIPGSFLQGNNCWFLNLSFTHSAGTLTISGGDGTALGASNPAFVMMPSNATTGRLVTHKLTANQTLTVSDMTGNLGYKDAGDNLTNAYPLYIGFMADSNDANLTGVVTWLPHVKTAPATSSKIGDPSAANADDGYSVFSMSDITEANFASSAVGLIGSLTTTCNGSDVYTLQTMSKLHDGVGKWNDRREFTFDPGQYETTSSCLMTAESDTPPSFSSNGVAYFLDRDGRTRVYFKQNVDGGRDGSGNQVAFSVLPIRTANSSNTLPVGFGRGKAGSVDSLVVFNSAPTSFSGFREGRAAWQRSNKATVSGNINCGDYANGSRWLSAIAEYIGQGVEP